MIEQINPENLADQYWRLNHLYYITDEMGQKVVFKVREHQKKLYYDQWYWNLILKARQIGYTTFIDIFILDTCLFNENQQCAIIAHTKPDAEEIFRTKIKFPYDNLPEEMRSAVQLDTENSSKLVFSNGSSVTVGTSMRSAALQILHVCLAGDTGILTKHGVVKNIKDILPGDLVLCGNGGYQSVKKLIKNKLSDIKEPLLSIKTFGYYESLKITANHSVLTREHKTGYPVWKEAKEIQKGDYIAFPIRSISQKLKYNSLPLDGYRGKTGRVKVNKDFGCLVGLYLAEGNIRRSELVIAGDIKEDKKRLKIIEKFSDCFNSISVRHTKDTPRGGNSRTSMIKINGRAFCDFMKMKFNLNGDKYIPDNVWGWGREFLDGLVFGYFDGGGSFNDVNLIQVTSIRRQLLDQLRLLLISMRFGYPTIYNRKAGEFYGRNCKEIWVLKLYGPGNWKFREYFGLELPEVNSKAGKYRLANGRRPEGRKRWRRGLDYYWSRVLLISDTTQEEFVYDIALDKEPHNYVTVNGVVHNSEFGKICANDVKKAREIVTGGINTVNPGNQLFIESTAEGKAGYFFDFCAKARKQLLLNEKLTKRRFKFHFTAWWEKPGNVLNDEETESIVIEQRFITYFEELEKECEMTLTANQKAWYVETEATQQEDMYREHPGTPDEAFKAAIKGAYYAQQFKDVYKEKRIIRLRYNKSLPVDTWWDIGVNDSMAVWFTQDSGRDIHCIRYYEHNGEGWDFYANILDSFGYRYGRHTGPHDLMKRTIGRVAKTEKELALEAGIRFGVAIRPQDKKKAIKQVRSMFPRFYFDEKNCAVGIAHLEQFKRKWNSSVGDFMDQPCKDHGHIHAADALQTLALSHTFRTVSTGKRRSFKVSKF